MLIWLEWANLAANLTSLLLLPLVAWLLKRTTKLTTAVNKEDATTLAALGRIEASLHALLPRRPAVLKRVRPPRS